MENQASKRLNPEQNPELELKRMRQQLLEQVWEVTTSPGVYLMKDDRKNILYVGKAKSLKNRLLSYFQPAVHEIPRTEVLVNRINHFDVILTETEAEALILEATLIKKYKPKFNVRLKDDKAYPYIKIQVQSDFPRLEWTRKVLKDGARYFGPFPSAWAARQVMQLLTETFHLRDCSDNVFAHRSRPCILFQMGKCSGSCVGKMSQQGYRESIDEVVHVLEGHGEHFVETLQKGMQDAAEKEEFEEAARYRDQIRNLELVTQTQGVVEAGTQRNRDVLGLARKGEDAHGTLLRIRGGRLVSVQHYHLQNTDSSLSDEQILEDFISQYYLGLKKEETPEALMPQEVLLPQPPLELDLLEKTLELKFRISESAVDQQLLNVARVNAEFALEQSKTQSAHGLAALEEVQEKLHLSKLPHRIECYDISNFQGTDAVASRVVFVDGNPDKNLYRRYKIRTVEGSNDFAMMKEVLSRRFRKTDESLPDLVVVDGGKGQLAQAVAVMEELGIQGVGVVGLAKARTESNFQAQEVKASLERIFIPNRKNPVSLHSNTQAYKLLVHIRDEAHRFAVNYHRLLRDKKF